MLSIRAGGSGVIDLSLSVYLPSRGVKHLDTLMPGHHDTWVSRYPDPWSAVLFPQPRHQITLDAHLVKLLKRAVHCGPDDVVFIDLGHVK